MVLTWNKQGIRIEDKVLTSYDEFALAFVEISGSFCEVVPHLVKKSPDGAGVLHQ
jgi:hypothetical protein